MRPKLLQLGDHEQFAIYKNVFTQIYHEEKIVDALGYEILLVTTIASTFVTAALAQIGVKPSIGIKKEQPEYCGFGRRWPIRIKSIPTKFTRNGGSISYSFRPIKTRKRMSFTAWLLRLRAPTRWRFLQLIISVNWIIENIVRPGHASSPIPKRAILKNKEKRKKTKDKNIQGLSLLLVPVAIALGADLYASQSLQRDACPAFRQFPERSSQGESKSPLKLYRVPLVQGIKAARNRCGHPYMNRNVSTEGHISTILVKYRPFCEANLTAKVLKTVPLSKGTASLGEQGVLSRKARRGEAELVHLLYTLSGNLSTPYRSLLSAQNRTVPSLAK